MADFFTLNSYFRVLRGRGKKFMKQNVFAGIYSGRFGTIRMVVARAVDATQASSDSTDSEKNFQISESSTQTLNTKVYLLRWKPVSIETGF
jgi:hypothetical protein